MESELESAAKDAEDRKVPEPLLQRLHEANERFHQAKQQLEQAMGDSEFDHQRRIDQASEEVRQAERDLEETSLKVHGSLKKPAVPPAKLDQH